MSLGQRIAVMREGVIEQIGAPMDIYDNPASQFVGGFIGAPPMKFLRGAVRDGGFAGDGFSVPSSRPRAEQGRELVLGVGADHIVTGAGGILAKVGVAEAIGSNALVTSVVGKTALQVQVPV